MTLTEFNPIFRQLVTLFGVPHHVQAGDEVGPLPTMKELAASYYQRLRHVPASHLKACVDRAGDTLKYFPRVSELLDQREAFSC